MSLEDRALAPVWKVRIGGATLEVIARDREVVERFLGSRLKCLAEIYEDGSTDVDGPFTVPQILNLATGKGVGIYANSGLVYHPLE